MKPRHQRWAKAVAESGCQGRAVSVANAIALHFANWRNPHHPVWPTVAQLAGVTGLSPSTANRGQGDLRKRGYLTVVSKGGTGHATQYRLTFPKTGEHHDGALCGYCGERPSELGEVLCATCLDLIRLGWRTRHREAG